MELFVVVLTVAAIVAEYFGAKDTRFNRNRWYMRARNLRPVLTILAVILAYAAGQFATRAKQAEVEAQQRQLDSIGKNLEALVAQGRLSVEDAKRVLTSERIGTKEELGIKVTPAPRRP